MYNKFVQLYMKALAWLLKLFYDLRQSRTFETLLFVFAVPLRQPESQQIDVSDVPADPAPKVRSSVVMRKNTDLGKVQCTEITNA